ncbi:MAG: pyrroloquinoline quinone precursor peptide PqqA [Hyphomicrobiales bacterium]|nr:pyrroloquinoline quinone precursor peptide PqqA [Hyphomicrobiales bacterium]
MLKSMERAHYDQAQHRACSKEEIIMAWTTPEVTEVCVGMEVTSYESAEL